MSFDAAAYSATEGGPDATVTVTLSSSAPSQVDIPLTAEGRGGAIPTDWSGVPERLTFNAGDTSRTLTLVAIDDEVEDDGEMVKLGFGTLPDGFTAGSPATARVTLMNDDVTPPVQSQYPCPPDSGQRIVMVGNGEISQAGQSEFWKVELDPWRTYVIEVLGADGVGDIMGAPNPGNLTLDDPHLFAVWDGDRKEVLRSSNSRRRVVFKVDRADDFSGFHQFEVRSFGGNTGTYQIKIRVNNICVTSDGGNAIYSYSGGPDGYLQGSDPPADTSTGGNGQLLRPRPADHVNRGFYGFLGGQP